ncbi:uncharacterized protein LOC105696660 [Orussus abietinus]|uniref:uncharacterized protein LOC105696660 n=1 Tax=Orussus abietinus TaxID=222816 RepID=UPI0006256FEB|nr:uncharacterized protein LOC105696660 [Orussus abietinus]
MKPTIAILLLFVALDVTLSIRVNVNDPSWRDPRSLHDQFKAFLESFSETLQTGNDTLGIPVLDPLDLKEQPFVLNEDGVEISGEVQGVKVDGLSVYEVGPAKFGLTKLVVGLTWPKLAGTVDKYTVEGNIGDFVPVQGSGDIKFTAKGLRFESTIYLKVGKNVQIRDMDTTLSLDSLDFVINGLYNDEEVSSLISTVISDMAPELLDGHQDEITEVINNLVMEKVNDFLFDKSLKDLYALLGNKGRSSLLRD